MKRQYVTGLLLATVAAISLVGCAGIAQVAQGIAENAPPAAPPIIVKKGNLLTWQNDPNAYSKWPHFNVDVRYGLGNKLILLEDGVVVPRFDMNDPANDAHTVYTTTDVSSDTTRQTITSHLRIMPPTTGYTEGRVVTLTLQETSINPKYKGTAQEVASSSFTVVSIKKPCIISLNAPASANQGGRFDVNWSANDCKRYDFIVDGQTLEGRIFSEPANSRSATLTFNADKPTRNFKLRGINATGQEVLLERTVNVTMPPPVAQCPSNPGGQQRSFNLKAVCASQISGDYCYEIRQVMACNDSEAIQKVQPYYANCAVSIGDCPLP
jgi:hypothetical protein